MKTIYALAMAAVMFVGGTVSAGHHHNRTFSVGSYGCGAVTAFAYQPVVAVAVPVVQVPVVQVAAYTPAVQVSAPAVSVQVPQPVAYENVAPSYAAVSAPAYATVNTAAYGVNALAVNYGYANNFSLVAFNNRHNHVFASGVHHRSNFSFRNNLTVSRRPSLVNVNVGNRRAGVSVRSQPGTVTTTRTERRGLFGNRTVTTVQTRSR